MHLSELVSRWYYRCESSLGMCGGGMAVLPLHHQLHCKHAVFSLVLAKVRAYGNVICILERKKGAGNAHSSKGDI